VDAEAANHGSAELIAFLRETVSRLEVALQDMTPAQLAYRPPGAPSGLDASGDEHHFDTSELATHVVSALRFYWRGIARAMRQRPPDFPPPAPGTKVTGSGALLYMGSAGWSGVPAAELASQLRTTAAGFFAYLETLPLEAPDGETGSLPRSRYAPFDVDLTVRGWLLLAVLHCAVHLRQLEEMKSQPDYPAC
jgi:hypothetical protein